MKWQDRLIKEKTLIQSGQAEANAIRYFLLLYFVFDGWLHDRNMEMTLPITVFLFIGYILFHWSIGKMKDIFKLYDAEAEFGNHRNPLMLELKRFLARQKKNKV